MKMSFLASIYFCMLSLSGMAQYTVKIHVNDTFERPIPGAEILINNQTMGYSDSQGVYILTLPPDYQTHKEQYLLSIIASGFAKYNYTDETDVIGFGPSVYATLRPGTEQLEEVTVVSSTRTDQPIETSPVKIEVLGKEELGEENGIKPGSIASILSDVSGVQIQQSSAVTNNSNVRIQGLPGRYTQILRDGMPLFEGFSGGLGVLTIPPSDLSQIELIKGSASTLYGGGAIGGLINLISRRPSFQQECDAILNVTSLGEFNSNLYIAQRKKRFGYSFVGGYSAQKAMDVNGDGFSDVPTFNNVLLHPRLFYYPNDKTIISLDYTGTFDRRKGGDMKVINGSSDTGHQYYEENRSSRNTFSLNCSHFFTNERKVTVKALLSDFSKNTTSNTYAYSPRQTSYYSEISYLQKFPGGDLVAGINLSGDDYKNPSAVTGYLQHFSNKTLGAFAQYSRHVMGKGTIQAGIRGDRHFKYGTFVLPSASLFLPLGKGFGVRAGVGTGYKTPNPLVQTDIEYNPLFLRPSDGLKPEYSYSANLEVNYSRKWEGGGLIVNEALYATKIDNAISIIAAPQSVYLSNGRALSTLGSDTYFKVTQHSWELYAGYTHTDARRKYGSEKVFVPLNPRNRCAFVVVKEVASNWRFGLEGSYIGNQYRYDATKTPAYYLAALMVSKKLGEHVFIVANVENTFNYKMSDAEPLFWGSIANPEFKPLWAPIDGRVVNVSVRWKL